LEALSVQLAGISGRLDWFPHEKAVVVCAGDHGVTAQGVSAYPQAVTAQMVLNFLRGGAAVNVLARQMGARVLVVDAGVAADFEPHPQLIRSKIAYGTADFSRQAAMSEEQAQDALLLGLGVLEGELERGLDILAVGEMGIGNTSAASAIISVITGRPPGEVAGRGTGLGDEAWRHKISVIEKALALHQPRPAQALMKVGGLEIGAMAGLILGAAAARVPVILDGLISTAAALVAHQLRPEVLPYLIAGHRSQEPGHAVALAYLGLRPLLDLDLRLGEGSGAVLALPIIEAAMRHLQEMATFEEAGVSG
jgi:nicotinate-nucleotide--dimethylbenzimidazole phosphoribosyltransferase